MIPPYLQKKRHALANPGADAQQLEDLKKMNRANIEAGTDPQFTPKTWLESVEASARSAEKLLNGVLGAVSPEWKKNQDAAAKAVEKAEMAAKAGGVDATGTGEAALMKYTDALQQERHGLMLTTSEREIYLAQKKLEVDLTALGIPDHKQYLDDLRLEIELTQRLKETRSIKDTLKEIEANKALLAIHGDELEIQTQMYNMFANARKADIALDAGFVDRTKKQLENNQQLEKSWKKVWEAADGIGTGVGNFLDSIILKTASFKDAMLSLIKDIDAAVVKSFITQPIAQGVASFAGKVLGGFLGLPAAAPTPVKTYAEGGVVSGPMMFQMGNGQLGLMGEAGEEEIVPRGKSKRGGTTINQYINISTPNADSFRRSASQVKQQLSRGLR